MSLIQIKCEKCGDSFDGIKVYKVHLEKSCQQDQLKTLPVTDFIKKMDEKVEEEEQRGDEISSEDTAMDLSDSDQEIFNIEKQNKNTLADLTNFMEENDLIFSELNKEVIKSKEAIMNATASLESMETSDVSEPIEYSISTIVPPPPQRSANPPPPVIRRKARVGGSRAGGSVPFLQCIYCGKINSDKISLARHMIASHWADVREAQGGGSIDNSRYYSHGIEDNRIFKPKQTRAAKPLATTYQRGPVRFRPQVETNKKITNASRNTQSSLLRGKIPDRKLPPAVSSVDLTSSEECAVCDDEFSWPEGGVEEHRKICVKNRNKCKTAEPLRQPLMEKKQNSREIIKTLSTTQKRGYQKNKNLLKPGMEKLVQKITTSNSNIEIRLV